MSVTLSLQDAEALVARALAASRTSDANARVTARALVAAEADGQLGHGLVRVPSYAEQAQVGKIDGFAQPEISGGGAAHRIDAGTGFAYPAIELALASYAGFHVTAPPGRPSAYGVYTPTYVDRDLVRHTVHLPDGTTEVIR